LPGTTTAGLIVTVTRPRPWPAGAATPFPVSWAVAGPPGVLNVSEPLKVPAAVGVNTTW
jgi:hypothetical protein